MATESELREAAARLIGPVSDDFAEMSNRAAQIKVDYQLLAVARLAEYDETPVTVSWILDCGWIIEEDVWPYYQSPKSTKGGPVCRLLFDPLMGCDGWRLASVPISGGEMFPPLETRGQVLRMCNVLGIPLTENQDAED